MKKSASLFGVLVIVFVIGACTYRHSSSPGGVPPGQAKKMSGSKSARAYAPGQQKKH